MLFTWTLCASGFDTLIKFLSYLVSSCLILSCLVLSCLVLSRLVSSRLVSYRLISSHFISSHLISSHLISSHLISSHLILSYATNWTVSFRQKSRLQNYQTRDSNCSCLTLLDPLFLILAKQEYKTIVAYTRNFLHLWLPSLNFLC